MAVPGFLGAGRGDGFGVSDIYLLIFIYFVAR